MLSELQRKKLTHYFNVLDADKNGELERSDFVNIGESLCVLWNFKEGTEEYDACINRCASTWVSFREFIGKPQDGKATLEEWLEFADHVIVNGSEELYEKHVNKIAQEIFDFFDSDRDGHISLDEYIDLFMAYKIDMKFSAKSFTNLDRNQDDFISRDELLEAIKEFFRSDDKNAAGNWLFGFWEAR